MKTIITCLIFSCIVASQINASASSANAAPSHETMLERVLAAHNKGELFPDHRVPHGQFLMEIQRKEYEITQAMIEVANKPIGDSQKNLQTKHGEYCVLLRDQDIMPQMSVYRLVLENESLKHQLQNKQKSKSSWCCGLKK